MSASDQAVIVAPRRVEIGIVCEIGTEAPLGWRCRGHVSADEFLAELRHEWEMDAEPSDVVQSWCRNVPCLDDDGSQTMAYTDARGPGRGAYAVTSVERSRCWEAEP